MAAAASRLLPLLPYGAAAALLAAFQASPLAHTLNLLAYDGLLHLRPAGSGAAWPVLLVVIQESTIDRHGWPLDDGLLCRAIDRLGASGAAAIGLDLYRDRGVGPQQRCLPQRLQREPRLVAIFNAAEAITAPPGTPPHRQAFNDLVIDDDGVVRRDLVHVSGQPEASVALPLRLLEVAGRDGGLRRRIEADAPPWWPLLAWSGGYGAVDDAGHQRLLPFRTPGSFRRLPLEAVLQQPAAELRRQAAGRIVLIGSTAPSLRDSFAVPHSRFRPGSSVMQMSGVELHAQRLVALQAAAAPQAALAAADPTLVLRPVPAGPQRLLCLLLFGLGVLLGERPAGLRRSVLLVAAALPLLLGLLLGLFWGGWWLGLSLPLASFTLPAGVAWLRRGTLSQLQRQQFQRLLGQTTTPAVAEELWRQRETLLHDGRFEGRQLPVTVLFADIAGFTGVAEGMTPAEVLAWLNRGMAEAIPVIARHGGMVNKFTGDGFLAVFGAPLGRGEASEARAALQAALEIRQRLEALALEPPLRLRIGVHSGDVIAGSLGSSERFEYAVMGDAVNCAARLESVRKERHPDACRVLVSAATRALVGDLPLRWSAWGRTPVKGRREPLEIWELRG
jgi:adenylate cyclase